MSAPTQFKRRRLNDPTAQLTKPFVSPLRDRPGNSLQQPRDQTQQAQAEDSSVSNYNSSRHHIDRDSPRATVASFRSPAKHPRAHPRSSTLNTPARSDRDPESLALQRQVAALETGIREARKNIDLVKQAEQVSASSRDGELSDLSAKWRLASQAVAEELFGTVKERVYRMGGVAAWRAAERQKHNRFRDVEPAQDAPVDDDADCEFDSQGEELSDAEQEYRKKLKRDARRELQEAAEEPEETAPENESTGQQVWAADGNDDDTFTMEMMLQSLNINPETIGYDPDAQGWLAAD